MIVPILAASLSMNLWSPSGTTSCARSSKVVMSYIRGQPMPWKLRTTHPCYEPLPPEDDMLWDVLMEHETPGDVHLWNGLLTYPAAHIRAVNLGVSTKEEWMTLNALAGDVPADPEEYYTRTGGWVSWDYFLTEADDILG